MPDITQIQIGNTTYDIADQMARRAATTTTIGLITDAPSDDKEYIRKNGSWSELENLIISVSSETMYFTF